MSTFALFSFAISVISHCEATSFTIQTDKPGPKLIDEFLSVTIDAGLAGHFNEFDFNSPLVNTLAKGLAPLYFRYGGTSEDETVYDTNGNITISDIHLSENTLNLTEFSIIAKFAQKNDWKFVFGLNAQERFANNTWNPSNSRDLMKKIIESGTDNLVIGWELGNEPDLYYRHSDFMNVTAQQLAKDFVTLYKLINDDVYKNANYKPVIWGCDVAGSLSYLQNFVESSTAQTIDAVTWHQYYGNGAVWTLADFVSVSHLDSLIPRINQTLEITRKLSASSLDILGETSSTYGGGTANLSSGFVAGFVWLDKLGLGSSLGLHVVARQDFWGGNYGLIGLHGQNKDFNPNPDYWSSYLFRNLVGEYVLYVDDEFKNGRNIRTYAFCTKTKDSGSIFDYNKGSVTTMILNLQNNTVSVDLNMKGINIGNIDADISYDEYLLTSYPNVIQSRDIFLNDKVLKMVNDNTFPVLEPVNKNNGATITMKALSYGYVVIVNANATACL